MTKQTAEAKAEIKPVPVLKVCPKCGGCGWVEPESGIRRCPECNGSGRVKQEVAE